MATVDVYSWNREVVGQIELDSSVFGVESRRHLLHLAVRKQLAARRQGTHCVRNRSDVRGGGKKPWKQKGTGRARQGSSRAPHWRGGGSVFGPRPRSYDFKVNKKQMRMALCAALSGKFLAGDLVIVEDARFEEPRTKLFLSFMKMFQLDELLLVVGESCPNVRLAARNVASVTVLPPIGVNVFDVLLRRKLVLTRTAVMDLHSRLGGVR